MLEARIDLNAIRDNTEVLVRRHSGLAVVADVAADGYGHGMVQVAAAAIEGGASMLCVSTPLAADELKGAGFFVPIVASRGVFPSRSVFGDDVVVAREELYGFHPDGGLRAAMRVSALVVATKRIDTGDGVSYGHSYRAERPTNLALVAIGYADGLDRSAGNVGTVMLNGFARRIAGRVAMNALVLELGEGTAEVGDEALVFGDPQLGEPSASDWADALTRSTAETVAVFGAHLPRHCA